jgi:hypothetical protein
MITIENTARTGKFPSVEAESATDRNKNRNKKYLYRQDTRRRDNHRKRQEAIKVTLG